jgi:hypothetical protein
MVFVLYKKMTGVAGLALKWGSEDEEEKEVREYLVATGVVKKTVVVEVEEKDLEREVARTEPFRKQAITRKVPVLNKRDRTRATPTLFTMPYQRRRKEEKDMADE